MPQLLTALVPAPDRLLVRLVGEIDIATAPQVAEALTAAATHGAAPIVVDLSGAKFWDVSGLHVLATFTGELAGVGRDCRIVGASAATRRLIGLADFAHELRLDVAA